MSCARRGLEPEATPSPLVIIIIFIFIVGGGGRVKTHLVVIVIFLPEKKDCQKYAIFELKLRIVSSKALNLGFWHVYFLVKHALFCFDYLLFLVLNC